MPPDIRPTTAERMLTVCVVHNIDFEALAQRAASNQPMPIEMARRHVAELRALEHCSMPVAIAIIDLIVEQANPRPGGK